MRFVFSLFLCTSLSVGAQTILSPVGLKGSIKFQIKNFGLTVDGTFERIEGKIIWDEFKLTNSSFDVFIDASSVNTGIALRDKHLRKEDYFDAVRFPSLQFKSTKISFIKELGIFELQGILTIKEIEKTISFSFKHSYEGDDHVFKGQFSLNRKDYGVGDKSLSLSDNVDVFITVKGKPVTKPDSESRQN